MAGTADFRDGAFAFITEGSVALRELGHFGVAPPIPNGESAVTALTSGAGMKKIYGATSGRKSHLFYYDPSPAAEHAVDIGVLGEEAECRILAADATGVIHGLVNPGGRVFRYDPRGEFSVIWKSETRPIDFPGIELGEDAAGRRHRPRRRNSLCVGTRIVGALRDRSRGRHGPAAGRDRRRREIERRRPRRPGPYLRFLQERAPVQVCDLARLS